jgi:hypothetical protein
MTAIEIDEVGQEAWDATQLDIDGNPPWADLQGDAKTRYSDTVKDVCTYGGASNEFELKAQEVWAARQEAPPEIPVTDAVVEEEVGPLLPPGTELTPLALAGAVRVLDERTGGVTKPPQKEKLKATQLPAPKLLDQAEEKLRKDRAKEDERIAKWQGQVTKDEKERREDEKERLDKEEDRIQKERAKATQLPANHKS